MKKLLCLVFSLMLAVMATGCGGSDKQAAAPQAGKTLRLAAAASMEKVFTQKLIPMYQQKHPEIKIESGCIYFCGQQADECAERQGLYG